MRRMGTENPEETNGFTYCRRFCGFCLPETTTDEGMTSSPARITRKSTPPPCGDYSSRCRSLLQTLSICHDTICDYNSYLGLCELTDYVPLMLKKCPYSCNFCPLLEYYPDERFVLQNQIFFSLDTKHATCLLPLTFVLASLCVIIVEH